MNRLSGQLKKAEVPFVLSVTLLLVSCDLGSYNPIARPLDPFEPMGPDARAWMRAENSSAESEAFMYILQQGEPVNGDVGSYVYLEVTDVKAPSELTLTKLTRGSYSVSGDEITFYPVVQYSGSYQFTNSPSNFPDPVDLDGTATTVDISYSDPLLSITTGSDITLVYTKLYGLDGILEYNSSDEARFLLLNQIAVYASQIIIPGFGGTGMMKYTTPSPFNGIAGGSVTVEMTLAGINGDVTFGYEDQENLPGLVMTNLLGTYSSPKGNGYMYGTVDSAIDYDMDGTVDVTAAVGYGEVDLAGTIPSGGYYEVDLGLGGGITQVNWDQMVPGSADFTLLIP